MFYQLQFLGLISAGLAVIAIAAVFIAKQSLIDPKKKEQEDKALLKELLEGFGLEVPSELNEPERTLIKPIKTP